MGMVDGPIIVVLKVEMHCEDCAMQVRRSVKGLKGISGRSTDLYNALRGVEAAASDILESKLTVIGKVDPLVLRGHVESKTHKKVELIYPATIAVKKEAKGHVGVKAEKPDKEKDLKNADGNRPNGPSATSVVLKVQLHCKGCTQRIIKQIYKVKGVDGVSVDSAKDLITVTGTMDVKNLPGFLTAKLRKTVEVVNLKKDGDGDKEKNEKKDNGDAGKKEGKVTAAVDGSKMDYYVGAYGFYPYRMEIVQAPQLFSDEDPNACSIM